MQSHVVCHQSVLYKDKTSQLQLCLNLPHIMMQLQETTATIALVDS